MILRCLLVIFGLAGTAGDAAEPAWPWSPVIPNNIGTQYGGGFDDEDSRAIARDLGVAWLRVECGWTWCEKTKGKYDFAPATELVGRVVKQGLRPIIIFDYGHPAYESAGPENDPFTGPTTPEAQQGYANFCAAAAAHFAAAFPDQVLVYEIWNEPNFKLFWRPEPDAVAYTRLTKLAYAAVKRAVPPERTVVLAPSTSSARSPFIEKCIDEGILDAVDAFSIHPYRRRPPESVVEDYEHLRKLIRARLEKDGKPDRVIPLVQSEWGYSATLDESCTIACPPELQGPYLARQWLIGAWQGIGVSIWFQWRGGSDDNPDPWSKFGMVKNDRTPRPSFVAAQTLVKTLRGYRCTGRLDAGSPDDYVLTFVSAAEPSRKALAAWTAGEPHEVLVPFDAPAALVTMTGETTSLPATDGRVTLPLSAGPVYVVPAGGAP